jgi:hypothetical protein
MLYAVGNVLEWIAAIGGVLATVGAWAGPLKARWGLRAEELRTGRAQRESELHRRRYVEVWEWQRNQPEGSARTDVARWFAEWTGAVGPRRGGLDPGPQTPGQHSGDVDDAYNRYIDFLSANYEPGRLDSPVPPLREQNLPPASPAELRWQRRAASSAQVWKLRAKRSIWKHNGANGARRLPS